jgi:hypothetical protein
MTASAAPVDWVSQILGDSDITQWRMGYTSVTDGFRRPDTSPSKSSPVS